MERRLPQHPGAGGARLRRGAARPPEPLGAPGAVLQRRCLPRARYGEPAADRGVGRAGGGRREAQDGAAARPLRRAGARGAPQAGQPRHRGRGRDPEAVARGGDAAPGRGERRVPAGGVRRRPLAGAPRRGDRRVPGPGRVLPAHLPDRESEGHADRRGAKAHGLGRRPRRAASDQLRRGQDPLDARPLPPLLRHRSHRAGRRRRPAARCGSGEPAAGEPRRARRQPHLARQSDHEGRRHGGPDAVGRAGLAVGRQGRLRKPRRGRRACDEPRRHAPAAPGRLRAMPDPDRRVGRLCASAPRPERPARGQLRNAVHLRPGSDRICEAGRQLPAGGQPPRVGRRRLPAHPGGRHRGGRPARARSAGPVAQRHRAHRIVVATGERGGRVRDRPAAAVPAVHGAGPVQGPGRRGPGVRRPLPRASTTRSSRPSAATPTTRSASRLHTPSTRRSSTACTRTGRRW